MTFFQKMSDATGLVGGMAERLDVDISQQLVSSPEIATRNYASMVMRCAHCSDHESCAKLQDENLTLDAAPDYCRNKDVLQRR